MTELTEALGRIQPHLGQTLLIAVSKTQPIQTIQKALDAGLRIFGENRVQEAQRKFSTLRVHYPDIELHLIGALQTNKAVAAVETFDVIQTLDRPALAEALAKAILKTGKRPRLYIEVNIGHEPQKAGVAPEDAGAFLDLCRSNYDLSPCGLMCMPPHQSDPRPYFEQAKRLVDDLHLPHLSMGMSEDYKIALECGATEIRLGSALFGARPAAKTVL